MNKLHAYSMQWVITRSVLLLLSAVFLLNSPGFTQSTAKYAGEFIAVGIGGRALGMGSAYTAAANDITSGYWNPAGLASIDYPQIALMHDERFAGLVNYDYAAVALPVGPLSTIALSVIRLGVDNIPNTQYAGVDINGLPLPPDQWQNFVRIDPNRITYFNAADWAFFLSYARRVTDKFSYGANLKLIHRDLVSASAIGVGFDVAARYFVTNSFIVGANLQDVTTTLVAWNTGRNELITPTLRTGGAYSLYALGGRFMPALDLDVRFENRRSASAFHLGSVSIDPHAGMEYDFKNIIAVRTGYTDAKEITIGAGIHLPKLHIDYSFARFKDSEESIKTHRISLTFTLEADQFKRTSQ
jgi:hypothetical protein